MKCEKCDKEADMILPYTQVGFCSSHFKDLTRKRVRLALKNYNMIDKGDRVGFILKNNASSLVCPLLVKKILGSLPIDYELLCYKKSKEIRAIAERLDLGLEVIEEKDFNSILAEFELDKLVLGRDLTHETDLFIKSLMEEENKPIRTLGPKTEHEEGFLIKPMIKMPNREVKFYAQEIGVDFKESKSPKFEKEVHKLIEKVKKRRANTRFSILKLIEAVESVRTQEAV